jgi:hypothetical protein
MRSDHYIRNAKWDAPQDKIGPRIAMFILQSMGLAAFFVSVAAVVFVVNCAR